MCACYCDFRPFLRNHLDALSGMLSKRIVRFGLLKDLSFFFFFFLLLPRVSSIPQTCHKFSFSAGFWFLCVR